MVLTQRLCTITIARFGFFLEAISPGKISPIPPDAGLGYLLVLPLWPEFTAVAVQMGRSGMTLLSRTTNEHCTSPLGAQEIRTISL